MKAWLLAAALFGFPGRANAAEPRHANAGIDVERTAGSEECAEATALARAVEQRLGRDVFDAGPAPELHVRVRFERVGPRQFRAGLRLSDRDGHELGRREISATARHCSALDASLALVIALLVDAPPAAPTPSPAAPDPPATAATPPPGEPRDRATPITLPADTFAPGEPWWFAVTLSGVAALGVLPGAAFGGAMSFGARPPRFPQIWVSAELLPERSLGSAPSTQLSLARFGLMLCPWELGTATVQAAACAGQRVGFVSAAGVGFDVNQSTRQLSYDLALELAGSWQFARPLFLRLAAGADVPLARPTYVSRSASGTRREWFQASPLSGSARLGVGLEF